MTVVAAPPNLPQQGMPSGEVVDALTAGIVRVSRRVEIYEADAVTPFDIERWDARLVGGNITIDRERDEKRACEIILENDDNALRQDPYDGLWYDKILKIFWGIKYFDSSGQPQTWETQVGEFMIDRIATQRFPRTVKVMGRDYAKKCLKSKIKSSMVFPQMTPIESIVRAVAANAGITKFALPFTGQAYSEDIVFERGTERWNVIKRLADSIGYEVFFRGDGYLTMQPYPDPIFSPLSWIFRGGELDGTLIDYEREANDSRIKNQIVVIGATISDLAGSSITVYAEVKNEDPNSPTRVARIGDRTEIIESDYITSNEQALTLAQARLRIAALEEYEVNFSSVILPWLDASSIVDVRDDLADDNVPQRFLLSSYSLPLDLGPMQGTARRVTIVGTTDTLEYE